MRLIRFFEETEVIRDLINNRADNRSDRDRIEDEEDNYVYPNPLPVLEPQDPRWRDWMTRGDELSREHGQKTRLPINQLIAMERFLNPKGLHRASGDKFSSELPMVLKVDGNYLIVDGNHRAASAYTNGETELDVMLHDVDAFEARMSA